MSGVFRRAWDRVAAEDGTLRRLARRVGVGPLLLRIGAARAATRLMPEGTAGDEPPSPDARGATLIGHPFGVQAVGEYLRASAAALAAAGVPFVIRSASGWGAHLRGHHPGFAFADRVTTSSPYRVNVFHVNANEMEDARRHLGGAARDRYTIGCWHWELARFPRAWQSAFRGVDELWASSRFMQEALAAATTKPVLWMPHPVDVGRPAPATRADFGLAEGAYLFLTAFDFNSYVARKNPLGVVRAFRAAFPEDKGVGLVLKMSGMTERPDEARAFAAAPELRDPRVVVVDRLLERGQMIGLIDACDAFVSLHRAEGFGRGLAEAMLLGKPVVATGYSGNMDFTTPRTACVVDFRLVPVGRDEYPHASGQVWAEPDLEHAASFLRRLASDRAWGQALAEEGRLFVEAQHGIAAVGRRYRARLEELGFV